MYNGVNFDSGQTARVFVGHYIYKGKAALTVEPKSPEFTSLDVSFGDINIFFLVLQLTNHFDSLERIRFPRKVLFCFSLLRQWRHVSMIGAGSR